MKSKKEHSYHARIQYKRALPKKENRLNLIKLWAPVGTMTIQFLTLGAMVYGYFHAVLPTIQYQKLLEESTSLNIKHKKVNQELASFENEKKELELLLKNLQDNFLLKETAYKKISNDIKKAQIKEKKALVAQVKAELVLTKIIGERDLAIWKAISMDMAFKFSYKAIIEWNNKNGKISYENISSLGARWPEITELLQSSLDELIKNHDKSKVYQKKYLYILKKRIEENKTLLTCDIPNFMGIANSYRYDINHVNKRVATNINNVHNEILEENKYKKEKEPYLSFDKKAYTKQALNQVNYEYGLKIRKMTEPCIRKGTSFLNALK